MSTTGTYPKHPPDLRSDLRLGFQTPEKGILPCAKWDSRDFGRVGTGNGVVITGREVAGI